MNNPLRFAAFGCGFWSQYQLAAWRELEGAELAALYSRNRSHAADMAARFGIAAEHVYDDAEKLLENEPVDFIDIITNAETHEHFTCLAARHRRHVICQKPMAIDTAEAMHMLAECRRNNVSLAIHENWRWQAPIRAVARIIASRQVGTPFRARITYSTSFPVFDNQPFLRSADRFIIADIGSHLLDTVRFLFGETRSLWCRTQRINKSIKGEDVATVLLEMHSGMTVNCEMSYASPVEHDRFPETYMMIECVDGSVELGPNYQLRVTRKGRGTNVRRIKPPWYAWANPQYDVVHASIVDCNRNLLCGLSGSGNVETSGDDNFKTIQLVDACYDSAQRGVAVNPDNRPEQMMNLNSAIGCGAAAVKGKGYEYFRPKAGIPYPYEQSENLTSASSVQP